MKIGHAVRALRIEKGITQEALALELETATSTLSRIEKNQRTPSLDLLERLARALGMQPSELLRAAEPPTAQEAPRSLREPAFADVEELAQLSRLYRSLDPHNRVFAQEIIKLLLRLQRTPS